MTVLENKTIVVIGGGVIGRGSIDTLARAGANIVIGDLRIEEAEAVADTVRLHGVGSAGIAVDLGRPETIAPAINLAIERFGRIDGLYLNAADGAAALQDYDILTVNPSIWEQALKVNLTGNFHAIRAALPPMLAAGTGAIVCTSSDDAFMGAPLRVGYATSKAAILALVRHVATRFGKEGIRCNAICPGLVPHPEMDGAFGQSMAAFNDAFLQKTPSPRLGHPADIGAMVRLLMSDEGAWINGQSICVDGGLVMR